MARHLSFLCALCIAANAQAVNVSLLDADFNSEPLDQPIAIGGPEFGEPDQVDSHVSAIVRAAPRPSPSLELAQLQAGQVHSVRFQFLDDAEITHGDVTIRLTLWPDSLDFYIVDVREHGSAAKTFLSMTLDSVGRISINDANGFAGYVGTYTAGADHRFVFTFHMDLGTYDVEVDSVPLLTDRAHGITDRGVGSLLVGIGDAATTTSRLYLDRVHVVGDDTVFADGFE